MRKLPNPRSSIFSSLRRASTIESKTVLTMISECFLVSSETRATSSTSSAFVMDASCPLVCGVPGAPPCPGSWSLIVLALLEAVATPAALLLPPAARVTGHLAQVDGAAALGLHIVLELLTALVLQGRLHGQPDLLLGDVHLDDLGRYDVIHSQLVRRLLDALLRDFGDVHQALDPLGDLDEGAEIREPDDTARDQITDGIGLEKLLPDVRLELLDAQRQALILGVDLPDNGLDLIPLLQHFGRVFQALGPGHVGDVHQPVDAFLDLDESPEIRQIADLAGDPVALVIFLADGLPGVGLGLPQAERQSTRRLVDVQDDRLDGVSHGHHLRGVLDPLGPGHLRHVDEPFHAGLELDKGSVVGQTDDLALHPRLAREFLVDRLPRIEAALLVTQRHALLFGIELEDDHLDLIPDVEHFARVVHPAPRHVGLV